MEFFKIRQDIPFMRHALVFNVISLLTFLLAIYFLASRGLNLGVDFTGGTVLEVHYQEDVAKLPEIMCGCAFAEPSRRREESRIDQWRVRPARIGHGRSGTAGTARHRQRQIYAPHLGRKATTFGADRRARGCGRSDGAR